MALERSIIAWPQKTPVCLKPEQDDTGKAQGAWFGPATLDWRSHPSKTWWPWAFHPSSPMMTRGTYLYVIGGRTVADAVTTAGSPTVNSGTAAFSPPDVGEAIVGPGIPQGSTIVTVTDPSTVVISAAATVTAAAASVTIGPDPSSQRVRLRWENPRPAAPQVPESDWYLRCYDTGGHQASYFPQAVGMLRASDPAFDRARAVFTYVMLDPGEDGSRRIALRCTCHGRLLQLNERFQQLVPKAELLNEPGVALVVSEPVLTSWVEVLPFEHPEDGPGSTLTPVQPAVDYRSRLVNPTDEVMDKEFTFTHSKETTGTWSNELGLSLTVGASVEVGVEGGIASAKTTAHWEATAEARRTWGKTEAETQTVEDATTIRVPAHTALDLHIEAARTRVDVPFQYVVHRQLLDGTTVTSPPDRGVYQKVETLGTTVEVLNVENLSAVPDTPAQLQARHRAAKPRPARVHA